MSKEAMKLALDALEPLVRRASPWGEMDWLNGCKAITALREALAEQPAQQEPDSGDNLTIAYMAGVQRGKDLAQRTLVGLTDEEIDKAWRSCDYTVPWEQHRIDLARAIEAKLKEKNT